MSSNFSWSNIIAEFKCSSRLAWPLITSEIIYALNGFIAIIMVAHLGKEQLAANALVWEIYITVILFFIGILCAVGIMVAQSHGAKDHNSISVCFKQGLILALLFAPIMMLIMFFSPIILTWTKQDPVVIEIAKPFCMSLVWAMLPLNMLVVMHQFLASINKPKIVMVTSILAVPIEIFFYYALLFGKFGLPKMGLAGIGYGLTASYSLISIYLFFYLNFSKELKIYNLFNNWWKVNKKILFELIYVGLPLGSMFCIELGLFVAVAIMMGLISTTTLAAYQIANQYIMAVIVIIFALTQTVSVRIAQEFGKNNIKILALIAYVNLLFALGFMAIFSFIYICYPQLVIGIDIDIHAPHLQKMVKEAAAFLFMAGIYILIDCIRLIGSGALRGLKDTKFPMVTSIFGFWGIAFTSAYLFAFKFGFGGIGIWWGIIVGSFIVGLILFIRFKHLIKNVNLLKEVTKVA
jgi:multidrug resistance protein, MATE family